MPTTTNPTTSPVVTSSSRMGATVRRRAERFHPRLHLSRKVRVAHDLGVSEAAADKYLYGERAAHLIVAAIIESDLRAGDTEAVAMTTAPIEAAEMGQDILPLAQAMAAYDTADTAEDVEQTALNRKCCEAMTDAELERYARKIAPEVYAGLRCLAAIRAVQRDRRMAR